MLSCFSESEAWNLVFSSSKDLLLHFSALFDYAELSTDSGYSMESDKIEASVPFLTSDQDDGENFFADRKTHKEPIRGYSLVIASCFLLSIILTFISTFVFTNWTWTRNVDNFCALHTSQSWSKFCADFLSSFKWILI